MNLFNISNRFLDGFWQNFDCLIISKNSRGWVRQLRGFLLCQKKRVQSSSNKMASNPALKIMDFIPGVPPLWMPTLRLPCIKKKTQNSCDLVGHSPSKRFCKCLLICKVHVEPQIDCILTSTFYWHWVPLQIFPFFFNRSRYIQMYFLKSTASSSYSWLNCHT